MTSEVFYSIDTTKVVFEKFEDETVLINLENGNYYGIMKVGKDILTLMEQGISKQNLVSAIAASYSQEINKVEDDIQLFLSALLTEGIIQTSEYGSNNITFLDNNEIYEIPVLEKYSDMQDLILLDPIHDVSAKGWPNKNQ